MGGEIGKMDHTLLHFEIPAQDVEKTQLFMKKFSAGKYFSIQDQSTIGEDKQFP